MHDHEFHVTVQYVGKTPFTETVKGDPPFGETKRQAMKAYELEESAADKYELQNQGIDLDDKAKLSSLGVTTFTLTLTLKEEPVKG